MNHPLTWRRTLHYALVAVHLRLLEPYIGYQLLLTLFPRSLLFLQLESRQIHRYELRILALPPSLALCCHHSTTAPLSGSLVAQLGLLYLVVQLSELSVVLRSTTLEAPRIRVLIREQLLNL